MVIVLEGLTGKNASEKVTYGGEIKGAMNGNSYFTDATDLLTALNTATVNLNIANATGDSDIIGPKETVFDNAVKLIVLYVQGKIIGVADDVATEMVHSAFLGTKRNSTKSILDFSAKETVIAGALKLRKVIPTSLKGRVLGFIFQSCTDPSNQDNWKPIKYATKASVTCLDFVTGTRYYFRVALVVGEDQQPYSDVITVIKM